MDGRLGLKSFLPTAKLLCGLLPAVFFLGSAMCLADEGDEDMIGYDGIVNGLNSESQRASGASQLKAKKLAEDPFADIWMHGGFGFASTYQTLTLPSGRHVQVDQQGYQASLGIDLFSKNWMAEGTARSFSDFEDRGDTVSLKEFDLKILYKTKFAKNFGYRLGGGLNARYMGVQTAAGQSYTYTTPSSVATAGIDLFLTRTLSLGADVSSRNSLISETIDHGSLDMTVRLDAHF